MKITFRIRRHDPERMPGSWYQDYEVEATDGMTVLGALHVIHDQLDGTLAFRCSCRGAICGSCAMRINGAAALACKTQIGKITATDDVITLDPLLNLAVIKDLVVNQELFFREMRQAYPWLLTRRHRELNEPVRYEEGKEKQELDQWNRSNDCIKCQACFSDCPKRQQAGTFIGPAACVDAYRFIMDARDEECRQRLVRASAPGGVFDCEMHGNCDKVCPRDCGPMKAITLLRRAAKGLSPDRTMQI